jgi:lipid-A-disaccharide synthase
VLKIFIIAGEASGDNIGAKLIKELLTRQNIEIYGVGGEKMIACGLKSLFALEQISIMGFFEILPHIFKINNLINLTVQNIIKLKPDVVVTIDSAGFCMRVVKKLKKNNALPQTKFIHYVAPTVWAYKEKRAKITAKLYDHLLTILPFEAPYFQKEGLNTSFVGHSLTEETMGDGSVFREKYNILKSDHILCISPGSRAVEVKKLLPIFIEAVNLFLQKAPDSYIVIPTSRNLEPLILNEIKNINSNKIIICCDVDDKKDLINATNLALTKCGTITNEFAFNKVPMVAAYKVNIFSAFIIRNMLKIKYVSLINILAKKEIIKEFLQENCQPKLLFNELYNLYQNEQLREQQITNCQQVIKELYNTKQQKPSKLAADIVLEIINKERKE